MPYCLPRAEIPLIFNLGHIQCPKIRQHNPCFLLHCKTLNVHMPFISRAKQNCEIKGRKYGFNGYWRFVCWNLVFWICQKRRQKIILPVKVPTFRSIHYTFTIIYCMLFGVFNFHRVEWINAFLVIAITANEQGTCKSTLSHCMTID